MTTMLGMPAVPRQAPAPASRPPLAGLRYIEAETSRYCNRACTWCPNGHTGARREQQLMQWPLFEKITGELGAAGYAGYLALHNYNEPLANPRLHDELAHIAATVPAARPAIYTNGDLLKADRMEALLAAGVRYLRVTRYPQRPGTPADEPPLRRWMGNAGLLHARPWTFGRARQGLAARWEGPGGVLIEVIRPDIATYNDRGGTAQVPATPAGRADPCRMTATSLSIDYRGIVKMCCNVVPDQAAGHDRYAVGSAASATLSELWDHPLMSQWRELHAAADWSQSPACRTCVQALPETRQ
ncbi:MAG TPA: radical SAM/SPASM domain-containing protein [Trebonia sp.]|nr:radical SAM/SPASM domain-containing protein [Trebonia sp.]